VQKPFQTGRSESCALLLLLTHVGAMRRMVAILAWIACTRRNNAQEHGSREQDQDVSFPIHSIKITEIPQNEK
jgi:hypothetical protein